VIVTMADTNQKGTHNQSLTNFLLDGTNYLPWARAIKVALGGRLKLEHIMGKSYSIVTSSTAEGQPQTGDDDSSTTEDRPKTMEVQVTTLSSEWVANDLCVMSWIFNSMEPAIYNIFAYSNTSKELWDSLFEMYGNTNNSSRVFEIQWSISALRQKPGQTLLEHLGNFKQHGKNFDNIDPLLTRCKNTSRGRSKTKFSLYWATFRQSSRKHDVTSS
jgi:gag-polypeptide of LTR copia-type